MWEWKRKWDIPPPYILKNELFVFTPYTQHMHSYISPLVDALLVHCIALILYTKLHDNDKDSAGSFSCAKGFLNALF